jgi:hypothetical protein
MTLKAFLPLALVSLLLASAGCSTHQVSSGMSGVAPALSVERFLQAANSGDLQAMSRIFGTADGPIVDQTGSAFGCAFRRMGSWIGLGERCLSRQQMELRLNAIAMILRHDDYSIAREGEVPGRRHPTSRVGVDIRKGQQNIPDVPFLVVRAPDGRWLVEEIGLERITAR